MAGKPAFPAALHSGAGACCFSCLFSCFLFRIRPEKTLSVQVEGGFREMANRAGRTFFPKGKGKRRVFREVSLPDVCRRAAAFRKRQGTGTALCGRTGPAAFPSGFSAVSLSLFCRDCVFVWPPFPGLFPAVLSMPGFVGGPAGPSVSGFDPFPKGGFNRSVPRPFPQPEASEPGGKEVSVVPSVFESAGNVNGLNRRRP